jgi:calcium binding protein 39
LSYVINNRPEVLVELCNGYDHKESATPAGTVLREVLKSDSATAIILYDDPGEGTPSAKGLTGIQPEARQSGKGVFWKFFNWIDQGSFEVGADAFTTFRVSDIYAKWLNYSNAAIGTINQAQVNCRPISLYKLRTFLR